MRGEYIRRADAMGKITSSETQKALRTMTGEEAYVTVIGILNELPAADVVPVVRCKDCKHWHTTECALDYAMFEPTDDSFCSYGERKAMYEKCRIEVTEV